MDFKNYYFIIQIKYNSDINYDNSLTDPGVGMSFSGRYPVPIGTQDFLILMGTGRYPGTYGCKGTAHADPCLTNEFQLLLDQFAFQLSQKPYSRIS